MTKTQQQWRILTTTLATTTTTTTWWEHLYHSHAQPGLFGKLLPDMWPLIYKNKISWTQPYVSRRLWRLCKRCFQHLVQIIVNLILVYSEFQIHNSNYCHLKLLCFDGRSRASPFSAFNFDYSFGILVLIDRNWFQLKFWSTCSLVRTSVLLLPFLSFHNLTSEKVRGKVGWKWKQYHWSLNN